MVPTTCRSLIFNYDGTTSNLGFNVHMRGRSLLYRLLQMILSTTRRATFSDASWLRAR
jgi:hypothetical protein